MAKTTIVTSSGDRVTGEVVRRESEPTTFLDLALAVATSGLSLVLSRDDTKTTVKDNKGNHWTGREK